MCESVCVCVCESVCVGGGGVKVCVWGGVCGGVGVIFQFWNNRRIDV